MQRGTAVTDSCALWVRSRPELANYIVSSSSIQHSERMDGR